MTIRITVAAAAAAIACLSPVAALAANADRTPVRITVRHADLDLSRQAGRDTLAERIDHAVRRACVSTLTGLSGTADSRRCRDEMLRDADVQVAAAMRATAPVALASRR